MSFAWRTGRHGRLGDPMTTDTPSPTTDRTGRTLSLVGAVLGVMALVILPIVLGPIGAVLGFVGYAKGDKPLGLYVGIGSIITTILGMVIGAAYLHSTGH
jgi:hypothetical protein